MNKLNECELPKMNMNKSVKTESENTCSIFLLQNIEMFNSFLK